MYNRCLRPCVFPLFIILLLVATSEERCLMNHSLCDRKSKKNDSNKGKIHEHAFVDVKKAGHFLRRAKDVRPVMAGIFNINSKKIKESGSASGRQKADLNPDKEQQSGGSPASSASDTERISGTKWKYQKELTASKKFKRIGNPPHRHVFRKHADFDDKYIGSNKHYHSRFHRHFKRASSVSKAPRIHLSKLVYGKRTKPLLHLKQKQNGKAFLKRRSGIQGQCQPSIKDGGFNIACNIENDLKPRKKATRVMKNNIISRVFESKNNPRKFPRNAIYRNSESTSVFPSTFAVKYSSERFKEPENTEVIDYSRDTTESLTGDSSLSSINLYDTPVDVNNIYYKEALDKYSSPAYVLQPVSQSNMVDPLWVHRLHVGKGRSVIDDVTSSEDIYLNKYTPPSNFINRNATTSFKLRKWKNNFNGIRSFFTTASRNRILPIANTDEYFAAKFPPRSVKYIHLPFTPTQEAFDDLAGSNIENGESQIIPSNEDGNKLYPVTTVIFFAQEAPSSKYPFKNGGLGNRKVHHPHNQQIRKRKEINYFSPNKSSQISYRNSGKIVLRESKMHHKNSHFYYDSLDIIPNMLQSSEGRIVYKNKQENYIQSKIKINMPKTQLKHNNGRLDMLKIHQTVPKGQIIENSGFVMSKSGYPTIEKHQSPFDTASESRIKKLLLSLKKLLKHSKAKAHTPKTFTSMSHESPVVENNIIPMTVSTIHPEKPNFESEDITFKSEIATFESKIAAFFTERTSTSNDSHGTIPTSYQKIVRITVQKTIETPDTRNVANLIVGILGFILIVFILVTVYLVALKYQDKLKLLKPSLRSNKEECDGPLLGPRGVFMREKNEDELYDRMIEDNREIKLVLNRTVGGLMFNTDPYLSNLYSTKQHQKKIRNAMSGIIK